MEKETSSPGGRGGTPEDRLGWVFAQPRKYPTAIIRMVAVFNPIRRHDLWCSRCDIDGLSSNDRDLALEQASHVHAGGCPSVSPPMRPFNPSKPETSGTPYYLAIRPRAPMANNLSFPLTRCTLYPLMPRAGFLYWIILFRQTNLSST